MKILECLYCEGELDILGKIDDIIKKVRCKKCGFSTEEKNTKKMPEIEVIVRKTRSLFK